MKKKRKFNIAIVGLGNIGLNLYRYLINNKKSIVQKNNVNFEVKYVSAKNINKKRKFKIPKNKWLKNYIYASKLKDIDLIVELIGGSEGPAKKLVFNAIKNKKHVVTANKSLISKYGNKLAIIAEKNKVNLEFEAAVAGGIPIIRTLKEGLIANKNKKVYGILNGTSNYILSNLDKTNMNFEKVLRNAKKLVFNAIKNKKHVVTANKSLISKYGNKLAIIAEKNKVNIEFEAAVAGGIPIIRTLKEGLIANKNKKIYGILNGTSNYILSNLDKTNMNFEKVLGNAKELGYAESNPKSDLNGEDVKSKIQILSSLAFNCLINNSKINIEGINFIDEIDIKNANILGYKIKHLGLSEIEKGKLIQRVHPCLIKKESRLSNVNGVLNAIIIEGNPVGKSILQGEGAGPGPTTSALVSDICSILRGNVKFPFSVPVNKRKKIQSIDLSTKLFSSYIRIDVLDKKGVLSSITKTMSKNKISVKRFIQSPFKNKKYASIIIISHRAKNMNLVKCINELSKKNFIIKPPKFIRIEEI